MEQTVIQSPMGPLTLFAQDNHLTALVFGDFGGYDHLPLFEEGKKIHASSKIGSNRHPFMALSDARLSPNALI